MVWERVDSGRRCGGRRGLCVLVSEGQFGEMARVRAGGQQRCTDCVAACSPSQCQSWVSTAGQGFAGVGDAGLLPGALHRLPDSRAPAQPASPGLLDPCVLRGGGRRAMEGRAPSPCVTDVCFSHALRRHSVTRPGAPPSVPSRR